MTFEVAFIKMPSN